MLSLLRRRGRTSLFRAPVLLRYKTTFTDADEQPEAWINEDPSKNEGPLNGVRVLDFTRILAGPFCTMTLGDLGAEVIKVERVGEGDDTRAWGPPFTESGESAYFLGINRNKKSIGLDLKSEEGKQIARDLARTSDVVVENFMPGVADRLGVGYKELSSINPRLIYASITGFGTTGPYRNRPGYDVMVSAMGGLMSITGEKDGPPVKVGVALTDVTTGLFANGSISAALYAREKSGRGQKIELSLLETEVAGLVNIASNYLLGGRIGTRWGTAHESIVPYERFATKDGYVILGAGNDGQWKRLCALMKRPELVDDARFCSNNARVENREECVQLIQNFLKTLSKSECMRQCEEHNIPCCPINNVKEVFEDPQVLARKMLTEIKHTSGEMIKMVGLPVKFSDTKPAIRLPPPLMGEHTDQLLSELLQYSPERIAELKKKKVV